MKEFETDEAAELPQGSATSPRWTGAPFIALAHGLNEQCVELVCDLAASSSIEELPRFISQNRDLWRLLELDARKRVAAFPCVRTPSCPRGHQRGEGHVRHDPVGRDGNCIAHLAAGQNNRRWQYPPPSGPLG